MKDNLEEVVQFWMKYSIDEEYGGYFTVLSEKGEVLDSTKYHWLQGRQVWTFSKLYNQNPDKTQYFDVAYKSGYNIDHCLLIKIVKYPS